jgi:hypothetical protein
VLVRILMDSVCSGAVGQCLAPATSGAQTTKALPSLPGFDF